MTRCIKAININGGAGFHDCDKAEIDKDGRLVLRADDEVVACYNTGHWRDWAVYKPLADQPKLAAA